ncbi:MAG: hypothetical protein M3P08_18715 [Thermoproteota archaeon]|nr:hypothetical protein [Thermoproteota archaeon]
MSKLIFVAGIIAVFALILMVATAYAFSVLNVNMNKTVNLPIKPTYNQTTITDNGTCGYDGIIALQSIQKEDPKSCNVQE